MHSPKTLHELLKGLKGCRVRGDAAVPVTGIAYHSQQVTAGGVFVALRGLLTDGHRFVSASVQQGARVVVSEEDLPPIPGVTLVKVPQARLALAHLSAAFYRHPSRELLLVGITGTNGKTSTTFLLEAILSRAGHQVGVVGTVNYRLGQESWPAPVTTPESLDLQRLLRQMRDQGASCVYLEVSSHALDLRRVDAATFAAGVFTNLSQDHLDYHRDLEDYFAAKSRLFLELLADGRAPGGLAVLNRTTPGATSCCKRSGSPPSLTAATPRARCGP